MSLTGKYINTLWRPCMAKPHCVCENSIDEDHCRLFLITRFLTKYTMTPDKFRMSQLFLCVCNKEVAFYMHASVVYNKITSLFDLSLTYSGIEITHPLFSGRAVWVKTEVIIVKQA